MAFISLSFRLAAAATADDDGELLINTELKLKLSGWLAVRKANIGKDDDYREDGKVIRRIYYHFARKDATIVC